MEHKMSFCLTYGGSMRMHLQTHTCCTTLPLTVCLPEKARVKKIKQLTKLAKKYSAGIKQCLSIHISLKTVQLVIKYSY